MNKFNVLTTSLGNTLEWFDFGLFIFLAPIIGSTFFPHQSTFINTIDALMVFAAGFICRPIGGLIFGHFGDTRGRSTILRISVLMITLTTLLVGLLPSYQSAGYFAPIIFILLRLLQGISIGGEYSGVMIYLAESAPVNRRGFMTSFAATGANSGFLLATLAYVILQFFFKNAIIQAWAWRIPFLLAGIPGSFILYNRFRLPETKAYTQLEITNQIEKKPFIVALNQAPFQLMKIMGLACMNSSFYYVFFGFMTTYLHHYIGIPLKTALNIQTIGLITMLVVVPIAGFCGDKSSRKIMMVTTACGVILLTIPLFHMLQIHSTLVILFAIMLAAILSSFDQGNSLTAVVENCPANVRYSGIAFAYNVGTALFGGTAPVIVTLLTEKFGLMGPAYYLMGMASITLFASLNLIGRNKTVEPLIMNKNQDEHLTAAVAN